MSWVVLLGAASAWAQGQALPRFLEAAEAQNVDRRISVEQRNKAAAEFRQAWAALLPSLSASAGWTHNQYAAEASFPNPATGQVSKLVIIPEDQLDGVLRLDLPLIDTGRWFRALAASAGEGGAQEREAVTRDLVKRQVVASYYGSVASLAVRESAKRSFGVAEAQLKLMEVRSSAGASTELDLLRAKSEVQRTRQTVADTEQAVAVSRRTLRTLTGLTPGDGLSFPADDVTPPDALEALEARLEEVPAVRAALRDAEAAGRLATAARLALVPMVSAQFTQRFTNATGFQGKSESYNTGLNLTWRLDAPTFFGMDAQARGEQVAQLAVERARNAARDQLHADWQRLTAALVKLEAARAQVATATRAAQVARDRYAVGAATQVDVIQAERDLFMAEVGEIQSRTELATARASLRLSAALPLE